jgi:D-arabinose 1-dehydrogenase-like Zn-dependent alcohol dehydrogenase
MLAEAYLRFVASKAVLDICTKLSISLRGKVKTIVETYPLAEAPNAYQRVIDGDVRVGAVLTM